MREIEHNFKGTLKQHAMAVAHNNDFEDDIDEESVKSEAENEKEEKV